MFDFLGAFSIFAAKLIPIIVSGLLSYGGVFFGKLLKRKVVSEDSKILYELCAEAVRAVEQSFPVLSNTGKKSKAEYLVAKETVGKVSPEKISAFIESALYEMKAKK